MRRTHGQTEKQGATRRDTKPKVSVSDPTNRSRTKAPVSKTDPSPTLRSSSRDTTKLHGAPAKVASQPSGPKGTSTRTSTQKSTFGQGLDAYRSPLVKPSQSSSRTGGTSSKKPVPSSYGVSRTSVFNGQSKTPMVKNVLVEKEPQPKVEEDYEYEDDFEEDYESDFEEDISESEKVVENGEEKSELKYSSIVEQEKSSSVLEFEILEQKVEAEFIPENGEPNSKESIEEMKVVWNRQENLELGAMGDVYYAKSDNEFVATSKDYLDSNPPSDLNGKSETDETEEEEEDAEDKYENLPEADAGTITKEEYLKIKAQQLATRNQEAQMSYPIFQSSTSNQKTLRIDNYSTKVSTGKNYGFIFESDSDVQVAERKKSAAKLTRGRRLQSMIKLDNIAVELFHMDAIDYGHYMSLFASKNSTQVGTQTSEDNLDEGTQTDEFDQLNKWTQKPPSWSTVSHSNCDVNLTRQEALGVGCDDIDIITERKPERQFNFLQNFQGYSNFVTRASDLILSILELDKRKRIPLNEDTGSDKEGTIKLTRGLTILKKLEMHTLACEGEYAACSNGQAPTQVDNGKKHSSKNMITVWYLREPSMPRFFLRVWSHVTVLKLNPLFALVVCGNSDGSLNFWNLKDASIHHTQYQEQTIRTPCVNTSCLGDSESNHSNTVLALEIIPDSQAYLTVLSLDTDNKLISWSCIRSNEMADDTAALHFAAWSNFHVTISKTVKLSQSLPPWTETRCFTIWKDEENISFLLGSNLGYVIRGTFTETFIDSKPKVEEFKIAYDLDVSDFVMKVTCISVNQPLSLFAAAFEDAYIRIFILKSRRCILTIDCNGLVPWKMSWSERRPPILYVGLNDRLEIWDLLFSDLKPWKSVPLKKLRGFALFTSARNEYLMTIIGNELAISPFASDIKILTSKDEKRLSEFLQLLTDNS